MARLLAMAPGGPPGTPAAASGSPAPLTDEQVWSLLYPTPEQAQQASQQVETETGRDAAKFARSQQAYDNSLTTAKGIAARTAAASAAQPATDAGLYDTLFGREPNS